MAGNGRRTPIVPNAAGCRVYGGGLAASACGASRARRLSGGGCLRRVGVDDFDAADVCIDAANRYFFAGDEGFVVVGAPFGLRRLRSVSETAGGKEAESRYPQDAVREATRDCDRGISIGLDLCDSDEGKAVDLAAN